MSNIHAEGLQEWIDYCRELLNNNPYSKEMDKGSNDFDYFLSLAVKSKIYHTAIYEYKLKLDKMLREELNRA